MNLGSGRVVPQGVTIIDAAIADGEFASNETLRRAIAHAKRSGGRLHLMGLLSDGRVHSSIAHLFALIDAAVAAGVPDRRPLLSRRARYAAAFGAATTSSSSRRSSRGRAVAGSIASVTGRYYAMDRDRRWERTQLAYDLLANGRAERRASDAAGAVRDAYARGEDDEFVLPTIVGEPRPIEDGDAFIFFNFRPDRARQLTTAFNAGTTIYYRRRRSAHSRQERIAIRSSRR